MATPPPPPLTSWHLRRTKGIRVKKWSWILVFLWNYSFGKNYVIQIFFQIIDNIAVPEKQANVLNSKSDLNADLNLFHFTASLCARSQNSSV